VKYLFGATFGLVILIVVTYIQSSGHEVGGQIFTLTAMKLMGSIGVAYKTTGFRKISFCVSLLVC